MNTKTEKTFEAYIIFAGSELVEQTGSTRAEAIKHIEDYVEYFDMDKVLHVIQEGAQFVTTDITDDIFYDIENALNERHQGETITTGELKCQAYIDMIDAHNSHIGGDRE